MLILVKKLTVNLRHLKFRKPKNFMKTNFLRRSAIAALTLTTASFYFAQEEKQDSEKSIDEVVLVGVADIAKDRKTPVAVSTIKEGAIVEKLGNQEFPEVLNSTPSVYATKAGGGFGDSKINIRGFQNENIAVMVNGMPVNDMENGKVYWSNWAGLSDVTSAMQVQRGLGASKLAIASVGGTINIITRAADKKQGGLVSVGVGNNGYHKALFTYNTGKGKTGWSTSFLLSRTAGAMYADGTDFEGYNYYFALGFQPNKKHDFQLTITGAPQWHNKRQTSITITDYLKYGRRYNSDWGYLTGNDGVSRQYSMAVNYYHKPIASLNWDWNIAKSSKLSTVAYASFGRGAGTGNLGSVNGRGIDRFRDSDTGLYLFDNIVTANKASTPATGQLIRRTSVNSHNWFGLLTNFQHEINKNWKFSVGFDGRYYKGYHYQLASDFLGASGYRDTSDKNNPIRTITNSYEAVPSWNPFAKTQPLSDRIGFSNEGEVIWYGGFGQVEYTTDKFSAFVQGSVSNQGFQRIDDFIIDGVTLSKKNEVMNTKTGFQNKIGYNVKGGVNYNINEHHNVFGNVGYYNRQPFFNAIYRGNENIATTGNTNEKILGIEVGYGVKYGGFNANLNLYRTTWDDRYFRTAFYKDGTGTRYYGEINNLDEVHQGIEFDASYKINKIVTINGMFSIGDWFYKGNANAEMFKQDNTKYIPAGRTSNEVDLLLDKVKVGDAAQLTASAGVTVEPVSGLKLDVNWRYVDKLYANLDVYSFNVEGRKALQLPSYNLFDLGLSYKLRLRDNKHSFTFRGNVYNLFDTTYISESYTSVFAGDSDATGITYKGIDTGNKVYFGFGRTWAASVAFNF